MNVLLPYDSLYHLDRLSMHLKADLSNEVVGFSGLNTRDVLALLESSIKDQVRAVNWGDSPISAKIRPISFRMALDTGPLGPGRFRNCGCSTLTRLQAIYPVARDRFRRFPVTIGAAQVAYLLSECKTQTQLDRPGTTALK